MKWGPFALLAVFTIVFQCTIVQAIAVRDIWPDWMFILAVHYALWGPWPDAPLAAWMLGLLVDIHSRGRMGLHAFCFGGAAWAIYHLRYILYREHVLTQTLVTFVFAFAVRLLVGGYDGFRASGDIALGPVWRPALLTAVYTAACTPYLHWLLGRMAPWTGLRPARTVVLAG